MNETNLVNETIDERVLRLLGLQDYFDLDYVTYRILLKEILVKVDRSKVRIPPEEIMLLQEELKRIKRNTGRFRVKKKKVIVSSSVTNIGKLTGKTKNQKLLTGKTTPIQSTTILSNGLLNIVQSIRKTVDSIGKTLALQNELSKKNAERQRKENENASRVGKEGRLEEKKNGVLEKAKRLLTPFENLFDKIINFLKWTILGRVFKLFMDWSSDPKNKQKLTTIFRFLKDWWPSLLGAWFLFATPLGKFTRTVIGSIAKLTLKLSKFAIPKLLSFIGKNPLVAAGAITAGATLGAELWKQKEEKLQIEKESTERNIKPEVVSEELQNSKSSFLGMFGEGFSKIGGFGYASGGTISSFGSKNIFSGIVNGNTGTTVSGAGPDTQFFPIEGGGGAVLQKGESVLQVGAREKIIKEKGFDPLSYNIGSNANKPRRIKPTIFTNTYGGLIGLSNGGSIGIAAHHLKKDEALSSLTPGINDFTRPGIKNWSKINMNTPIYSYIDSVGQPTIGWGSTYYDSILNGKKPVKPGDKITKGKADSILSNNIASLANTYSTKIPNWNKMTDNQRAGLLLLGYNAPYAPIGAYPKLTQSLQEGDMRAASQNIQRKGPNQERIELEKGLLKSGPLNLKNLVGPKIVGPKKVGSGIPFIPPFMYRFKEGGTLGENGKVTSTTGYDIPGGSADTQFIPSMGLQVGEALRVYTKDAVNNGILPIVDYIESLLDPFDSKAAKRNIAVNSPFKKNIPSPPLRRPRSSLSTITLPPINKSSNPSSSGSKGPPDFSVSPASCFATRNNTAQLLGIMA